MDSIDIDGAKNRLQEYCQQRCLPLPVYCLLEKMGSDHSPMFQVEVSVNGMIFVGDWASKKREAEKLAAVEALTSIYQPPSPPKNISNLETKDPCAWFENLNLTVEEQQVETMECD